MTNERVRAIGPVGTYARVAVGFAAIALAFVDGLEWWAIPLGLVGMPLIVTIGHAWLAREYPAGMRELGMAGGWASFWIFLPLLIIPYTSDAAWLWMGGSMLLAAARGYAGCEILAVSNWLLRRDDAIGCLLFTPIDQAEARWQRAGTRGAESPDHGAGAHHRDEQVVSRAFSCCGWFAPRSLTTSKAARGEADRQ
ncbi:MAG: hypothetical protein ACRDJH_17405 [Thermomicrobiales bacterium]